MARTHEIPSQTPGSGEPDSPTDLTKRDWKSTIKRTLKEIKDDRITMIAAAMAYYSFIALFPALIAAVGIVGLLQISPAVLEDLAGGIRQFLPGDAGGVLADAIKNAEGQRAASVVAALIGVAVALWGASAAMVAVQNGLNIAYDIPAERARKFLKLRLVALELLAVTALLGGIASALIVFGQPLGETLRDALPLGDLFALVWGAIRWVASILALVVLFALFYYLAPNRESPRWTWISPGGVVAAVIWILASLGFSFYVSHFGKGYGETYGSLAGVVLLVLWLYFSCLAVLVGGELNAELERQAASRQKGAGSAQAPRERRWARG